LRISFPNGSPFEEGPGPFEPGSTSRVKKGITGTFTGEVEAGVPVAGEIIVVEPG
jgi:hypothetical protein